MNEKLVQSFEVLLKNGEYAEAEKLLSKIISANPGDWKAKLLYGTCRMLQGDLKTAKKIHKETAGYFESGVHIPEQEKNFWEKYRKHLWYAAIGTALIATGGAFAAKHIESFIGSLTVVTAAYAGPSTQYYCKECGNPTSIGWGWIRDEKFRKELRGKVEKGLIPCDTCHKDTLYLNDDFTHLGHETGTRKNDSSDIIEW